MMKPSYSSTSLALVLSLILVSFTCHCNGALQVGFYQGRCGLVDVETIVKGVIAQKFIQDPTIAAGILRMHFHDCFVHGCDASILLDGSSSEKVAPPNFSVKGYEVIDAAKAAVEEKCPGVVSCADILAIAARDSVTLSLGGAYHVETGRRDGFVSLAKDVDLPAPSITVPQSIAAFRKKGLNLEEMVLLLGGGHSIGVAHCPTFKDRLYNFKNTGKPDPTMDAGLLNMLKWKCPQNKTSNAWATLDQNPLSALFLDTSFYSQIKMHRGVLEIDQEIALEEPTKPIVDSLAYDYTGFRYKFGKAMVKMGAIQVLTGSQGEIRKSCRAVNKA